MSADAQIEREAAGIKFLRNLYDLEVLVLSYVYLYTVLILGIGFFMKIKAMSL